MKTIPETVTHYKSTPIFTETTVPAALLAEHNTKQGIWGLLNVETGRLKYVITEVGNESEYFLSAGDKAVIAPTQKHYVKPLGNVSFYVAFHK